MLTGCFNTFDDTKIFYRALIKPSQNTILLVHGFGEHSGRYKELMRLLSACNCSVIAFDMRGHGDSEGKRVYIDDFDDLVKDVYEFRRFAENKLLEKDQRFYIYGHSLGGLVSARTILKDQNLWKALVLSAPFFGTYIFSRPTRHIASFLNCIKPDIYLDNPVNAVFLTHDDNELLKYIEDKKILKKITARFAKEMLEKGKLTLKDAFKITLPVYVFYGSLEKIVSVKRILKFYGNISSEDKKIKLLNGFYHELHTEKERNIYFNYVLEYFRECFLKY